MKVNLNEFENKIKALFKDFTFEKQEASGVVMLGTLLKDYNVKNDGVWFSVSAYDKGYLLIRFTYDEIEQTIENFELINKFNNKVHMLTGYIIEEQNTFEIKAFNSGIFNTKQALTLTELYYNAFVNVDTQKHLKLLEPKIF